MRQLILNGTWSVHQRGEDKQYNVTAPGSVISALLDAEAIPDPFYGRNEYQIRELLKMTTFFKGILLCQKHF